MKSRPFFLLSALAMVAFLWIGFLMDREIVAAKVASPKGYSKPIIALEFAQEMADINAVFNLQEPDESIRKGKADKFDCSTNLDFYHRLINLKSKVQMIWLNASTPLPPCA